MAIFADGPAYQTNTVTTAAHVVFSANATALAALSPAVALHDVTIINTGTVTIYLGQPTNVTAATGIPLAPGQQITINGYTATSGTTTNDIWGITSAGTTTTEAGLATLAVNE